MAMSTKRPFQVGVTLYSFSNEFWSYTWSFEDCMEKAAQLGKGVEIVGPQAHRGFPEVPDEFVRQFKSAVDRFELVPTSYGSYADVGMIPGRLLTNEELIEYTIPQIKGAAKLGFPILRLQYFVHPIAEKLLPYAEKYRVKMGYELHSPLILESPITHHLVEQVRKLQSAYLGLIPDDGIFCRAIPKGLLRLKVRSGVPRAIVNRIQQLWEAGTPEEQAVAEVKAMGGDHTAVELMKQCLGMFGRSDPKLLVEVASYVVHVHGKFYSMENGKEPNIRHDEIVRSLVDGGFRGYMSSEYEGHGFTENADVFQQVKAHTALIKRLIMKYSN